MPKLTAAGAASGHATAPGAERRVATWLLVCCALVFATVVLGGVTRLNHAGLSIVDWSPLRGVVPPLSEQAWREAFEHYRAYPEFRLLNPDMTLAHYRAIYWLEYAHRFLGRLIGLVFLVPFLYFAWTRALGRTLMAQLGFLFLLGAMQGVLGWYMVKSGLVDRPDVSPYRLTAHLGLAVCIYGIALWLALGLLRGRGETRMAAASGRLRRFANGLVALIFLVMLSGGLVAGLDAGLAYNTFPLMDGTLVPAGLFAVHPWWLNFFASTMTVQFTHRVLGVLTAVAGIALWVSVRSLRPASRAGPLVDLLLAALAIQLTLGIATLVLVVPVALAAAHQACALVLFTFAVILAHELRVPA